MREAQVLLIQISGLGNKAYLRLPFDSNDVSSVVVGKKLSKVGEALLQQAQVALDRLETNQQLLRKAFPPPLSHHICVHDILSKSVLDVPLSCPFCFQSPSHLLLQILPSINGMKHCCTMINERSKIDTKPVSYEHPMVQFNIQIKRLVL